MKDLAQSSLHCPRCGYDVSGVVPTWTESCPLEGTCSECGLRFAWVDVFRPERLYPAWSFEHAASKHVRAWIRTLLIAPRPKNMWTGMPLAAPFRLGRLAIFVLSLAVLFHLVFAAIACGLEWHRQIGFGAIGHPGALVKSVDWAVLCERLVMPYECAIGDSPLVFLALWGVLVPLPYFILAQTMRRAKCRMTHLFRAWAHFLIVPGLVLVGGGRLLVLFERLGSMSNAIQAAIWNWWPVGQLALVLIWYACWWGRFTRTYLRLPQPWLVLAAMLLISFLGTATLWVLVWEGC